MHRKTGIVIIIALLIISMFTFLQTTPTAKAYTAGTLISELYALSTDPQVFRPLSSITAENWNYWSTATIPYALVDFFAEGISVGQYTPDEVSAAIDSSGAAPIIIYWYSVHAPKFGLTPNATAIKWALNTITEMANGLPKSGYSYSPSAFSTYEGYLLYVYYWANYYSYDTAKWDIQKGYASFLASTYQGAYGYQGVSLVCADNTSVNNGPRFYDEWGETARCFLIFYEMGIDDALNRTVAAWDYWNTVDWNEGGLNSYGHYSWDSGSSGYYQYRPAWNDFECEPSFFRLDAAKLQYYSNGTMSNPSKLVEDSETRFLLNGWNSYQWMHAGSLETVDHTVVHAYASNSQHRMQNTLGAWEMLYGEWLSCTDSDRQIMRDMLLGNGSTNYVYPAWKYLTQSSLYDNNTGLFKGSSTDTGSGALGSAQAVILMMLYGIVPITATIAVPVSEWAYESVECMVDYQLLGIDFSSNRLTLGIASPGVVTFIYGDTPFNYSFSSAGIYALTFASDWNNIATHTYVSPLPTNRLYLGEGSLENYTITVNSTYGSPTASSTVPQASEYATSVTSPVSGGTGVQYVCTGYKIDGGSLIAGTNYTFNNIQSDHTIEYEWQTQYYLTLSSAHGSPVGEGWWNAGTASFSVTIPVSGEAGMRYVFSNWSSSDTGGYSGTLPSTSITMANPVTETASWTTQYQIIPSNDTHSTISPSSSVWVDSGDNQQFNYSASPGYQISQVFVDGSPISLTTYPDSYTFNDVDTAHTISVSTDTNTYTITIQTLDESGNLLSGTTVDLNSTSYPTTGGILTLTGIPQGTYQGVATWQGVTVNASFSLTVNSNSTLNVVCTAWAFPLDGATRHIATDRPVVSATWNGASMALSLDTSTSACTVAFDSGARPTYISGIAYDLTQNWDSSSGVFTKIMDNSTLQLTAHFDNWGSGFYVQRVDTPVSSAIWVNQKLTFSLDYNDTGTFVLRCSSRGIPLTAEGMTATYDTPTTLLTGLYTNQSLLSIDWTQSHTGDVLTPSPSPTPSPLPTPTPHHDNSSISSSFQIANLDLGAINSNSAVTAYLHITYSGIFTLQSITLSQPFESWTNTTAYQGIVLSSSAGATDIPVTFNIPSIPLEMFNGTITISATDTYGSVHTSTAKISAVATEAPQERDVVTWIKNNPVYAAMAVGLVFAIIAAVVFAAKRRR